jgi:cysteine desulfurase
MIYLDYSATTPVNSLVLDEFNRVSLDCFGNANSAYRIGEEASQVIRKASEQIGQCLGVAASSIIYTSGASEANNLAIKGVALAYGVHGRHLITTELEHSSIYGPFNFLSDCEYDVDFVKLDRNGLVDLVHLKSLLRDDTILVSITMVNSEVGLVQPINEIGKLLADYPHCKFHVDMTQAVGKMPVDLSLIDLASFSAHKFYGLKGVGALIRQPSVQLEPLIHGGKSTTVYRSGTPATGLIASMAKALVLAYDQMASNNKKVRLLNDELRQLLSGYKQFKINSCHDCLPQILNVSVMNIDPHLLQQGLALQDVFISVQSACSVGNISKAVLAITHDEERAKHSVRISISAMTTSEELVTVVKLMDEISRK